MELHKLTSPELQTLASSIQAEQDRRERIRVDRDFIKDRTRTLCEHAESYGVLPFDDVPEYGHLPGQVVAHHGRLYRNASGIFTTLHPGETLTVWEDITPPDPEDEPEAPADDDIPEPEGVPE